MEKAGSATLIAYCNDGRACLFKNVQLRRFAYFVNRGDLLCIQHTHLLYYLGTLDCVAVRTTPQGEAFCVIDWKTSNSLHIEYALQRTFWYCLKQRLLKTHST